MATRWLRELYTPYSDTDQAWSMAKALMIFLYRCCGYTNPTEYIAASGSWFSHENTGAAGAFTGTAKATGTITTIASASHVNGEQMTLDDGWNAATTFTFSSAPSASTDIDITGSVSADVMRDRIITAINSIATLDIEATNGGASTVSMTNYRYGTRGNTTSTENVTNVGFVLTNMTSGLDGWVMTDSGYGSFTRADVGKSVCVVDPTNAVNNGVFRVMRWVSANAVELDFKADPNNGEAFTSTSGLTWYMWSNDYELPAKNDWGRLDSPHSSGWALEVKRFTQYATGNLSLWITLCSDGNWGGSKITPRDSYNGGTKGIGLTTSNSKDGGYLCMEVDTEGNYLNCWLTVITEEPDTSIDLPNGFTICDIEAIEPDRDAAERIGLFGSSSGSYINTGGNAFLRWANTLSCMGAGYVWNEPASSFIACYLVDPSYINSAEGLTGWTGKEVNNRLAARTGTGLLPWDVGKNEVFEGSLVISDPDNYNVVCAYEFIGWAKGHRVSRRLELWPGIGGSSNRRVGLQCNQGGTKNRMSVYGAFIYTWPDGISHMMSK